MKTLELIKSFLRPQSEAVPLTNLASHVVIPQPMKTQAAAGANPLSEAKVRANRANAQLSSGPKDTTHSRFNALKHGLSARIPLPGQDTHKSQEFFRRAWLSLAPRNPIEEVYVLDLLNARLQEDTFLEVERTVLTRKPVSLPNHDERAYSFVHDPAGLRTLDQMSRHLAHLTLVTDKALRGLLRVRQENWGRPNDSGDVPAEPTAAGLDLDDKVTAENQPASGEPSFSPATLEDCLADTRIIFPGEDPQTFAALARDLWTTFRPANLLERFVACDFIQTHWRLERVVRIEDLLFERCAVSASGANCGVGFAFVQDAQRNQAFESLRHFEAVLRKRLEKRMTLWRKLRKQGWADSFLPNNQRPAEPQPSSNPTTVSSTCQLVSKQPGSEARPELLSVPGLVTASIGPSVDPLGPQANMPLVSHCPPPHHKPTPR